MKTRSTLSCLLTGLMLLASLNLKSQEIIFSDDFEEGSLDPGFWTPQPSIDGASGGLIELLNNNNSAANGAFSLRMGRSSDGNSTTNALDLKLDLSGKSQVELRFLMRSFFDETQSQEGLYFSDNGGQSFEQVYQFNQGEETQNVYLFSPQIDVDALAAANGLSLSANFVIRFQQIGSGDFSTTNNEDGFFLDDVVVFVPEIEFTGLPFSDDFEEGLGPMWNTPDPTDPAIGQPTAPASTKHPFGARTDLQTFQNGTTSLAMGRETDGQNTVTALDLRIDLEGEDQVELRFSMNSFYDETQAQEGLYFSDDGGKTFTRVYQFNQGEETQNVFLLSPQLDVDALAAANGLALTKNFIIRFQQIGVGNFNTSNSEDGFYIDQVEVFVPEIQFTGLPFSDGFEDGLGAMWDTPDPTEPAIGQPTAPTSSKHPFGALAQPRSFQNGTTSFALGRETDGQNTASALDLRLDLEGKEQVELRFSMNSFYDETQAQEGLYFSDDGGQTFKKVYQFNQGEESQNIFLLSPQIDVDALAAANGLRLTKNFIIRFQQIGGGNFDTSNAEDGFYLDDVRVFVPEIKYASIPFTDDFEEALGPMWHTPDPTEPAIGQPTAPSNAKHPFGALAEPRSFQNGTTSFALGRETDGQNTASALDLRLDLAGKDQVELRFKLNSFFDETQVQEGLYFSDDGGQTFTQVYQFNQGEESQNVFLLSPQIDVDALAAVNGLSLTNNFVIRFQQIGVGNFNTSNAEDGFYIDELEVFVPEIIYADLPFRENFEDGLRGMWDTPDPSEPAIGQPTAPSSSKHPFGALAEPRSFQNGTTSFALGRETDGQNTTNALDLRLNLKGKDQVEMRFDLNSFFDETQAQEGLYFSDDGGLTFTRVYQFNQGDEPQNVFLSSPQIDVDALARANGLDLTENFIIRFQQIGTGNFNTSNAEDGFYLDDVEVYVPEIEYTFLPFTDGFEEGFGPMWSTPDPAEPAIGQVTAPEGVPHLFGNQTGINLQANAGAANSGSFYVTLGREVDGSKSTCSALDLFVNLSGQSQVELRFHWADFIDETQAREGLFFSDNAGTTFTQVLALDPSNKTNQVYDEVVLDVDQLAAENGLSLSPSFVVRFQQIGIGDFRTSGSEDGFFIDDVSIIGDVTTSIESIDPPEKQALHIYPNPGFEQTNIEFMSANSREIEIIILDLQGKIIHNMYRGRSRVGVNKIGAKLDMLNSGLYIIELRSGNEVMGRNKLQKL